MSEWALTVHPIEKSLAEDIEANTALLPSGLRSTLGRPGNQANAVGNSRGNQGRARRMHRRSRWPLGLPEAQGPRVKTLHTQLADTFSKFAVQLDLSPVIFPAILQAARKGWPALA